YMDSKFDSGDIIAQVEERIRDKDTWASVNKRLLKKSSILLKRILPAVLAGVNPRIPQNEQKATVNSRLTPDYPLIDFKRMNDRTVFNLIRAQCKPLSGAYLINTKGKKIYFDKYLTLAQVKKLRMRYAK
ncbi:MAG TPA: hypothetical protein VNJ07_10305, partial [Chitinophagales bacterium]|nr:hypothetical protein [Chitinophagales bacterium]